MSEEIKNSKDIIVIAVFFTLILFIADTTTTTNKLITTIKAQSIKGCYELTFKDAKHSSIGEEDEREKI